MVGTSRRCVREASGRVDGEGGVRRW
uniref:Uncharacterized protein n=1 Tax=Arundo donax TaxID=35708 RepID=A0A0A8Z241_ARUDO